MTSDHRRRPIRHFERSPANGSFPKNRESFFCSRLVRDPLARGTHPGVLWPLMKELFRATLHHQDRGRVRLHPTDRQPPRLLSLRVPYRHSPCSTTWRPLKASENFLQQLQSFWPQVGSLKGDSCNIAARMREASDDAHSDRISGSHKNNRDCISRLLESKTGWRSYAKHRIDFHLNKFLCEFRKTV